MRFEGKLALVTGGLSGIGKAVADRLRDEGARVFTAQRGDDLDHESISADLADPDAPAQVVSRVIEAGGRLDVLVNNAGVMRQAGVEEMSTADWAHDMAVNLTAPFLMIRAALPHLRAARGSIVNIGSINGQAGQYGQVNYAATKSGIHGFTKALAQEGAAKGITVNAIAPGYVDTDMVRAVPPEVLEKIVARIPVGRLGQADDIARGVLFLTADNAGFITGSTLSINGGQHMY